MHIVLDKNVNGNFKPELYNTLYSIPESIFCHNEHSLRHPIAIFNLVEGQVINAFIEALKLFNSDDEKMFEAHKDLMDALMTFIDNGYHIMKCIFPKDKVSKEIIFADKWLLKVDKPVIESYKEKLEVYRKRLALIANQFKHSSTRYCIIECRTIHGKIKGYFIEGADESGTIGPIEDIHPQFAGMHTAISFNKDFKDYLINYYIISTLISKTLIKLINKHYNILVDPLKVEHKSDDELSLIRAVEKIPNLYFIDEYYQEIPQITIKNNQIQLRKPAYKKFSEKLPRYSEFHISVAYTGDGFTKSFKLPYMKKS